MSLGVLRAPRLYLIRDVSLWNPRICGTRTHPPVGWRPSCTLSAFDKGRFTLRTHDLWGWILPSILVCGCCGSGLGPSLGVVLCATPHLVGVGCIKIWNKIANLEGATKRSQKGVTPSPQTSTPGTGVPVDTASPTLLVATSRDLCRVYRKETTDEDKRVRMKW